MLAEIVITPRDARDLDVGGFIDNSGKRFVGLSFATPGKPMTIITMTPDMFRDYAAHLGNAASLIDTAEFWSDVRR